MVEEVLEREKVDIPFNERKPYGKQTPTTEEKRWAAIAHASTILTILGAIGSAGALALILPFVPLGIYAAFKDKSPYVAEQAVQAFAFQLIATIGLVVAALAGVAVIVAAWVITGLLSIILIGLLLIPVALLITLLVPVALALIPFVVAGLSLMGTVEAANGKPYVAPFVGGYVLNWVRKNSQPAV